MWVISEKEYSKMRIVNWRQLQLLSYAGRAKVVGSDVVIIVPFERQEDAELCLKRITIEEEA